MFGQGLACIQRCPSPIIEAVVRLTKGHLEKRLFSNLKIWFSHPDTKSMFESSMIYSQWMSFLRAQ
ncbi:MAG: hypothetical protein R8K46_03080, partial [Mariprofundaceae bacterium]